MKISEEIAVAWCSAYAGISSDKKNIMPNNLNRTTIDALAAWQKWHKFPSENLNLSELVWYEVIEHARVEAIASKELPGVAWNLYETDKLAKKFASGAFLYVAAREIFRGEAGPNQIFPNRFFSEANKSGFFATKLKQFIFLGRYSALDNITEVDVKEILLKAKVELDDHEKFFQIVMPLVIWLGKNIDLCNLDTNAPIIFDRVPSQSNYIRSVFYDDSICDVTEDPNKIEESCNASSYDDKSFIPPYKIFTDRLDEIRFASSYYQKNDFKKFSLEINADYQRVYKLAQRLKYRLQVNKISSWSYEKEIGVIDSRKLSRLLVPSYDQCVFRREDQVTLNDACVTILIDQSASMSYERMKIAALTIDFVIKALESCQIKTEVLGYTTCYKAESPIVNAWRSQGGLANPGRLNATRHIIYKSANQLWKFCRPYLGLLLRDNFGNENIDGEALNWAARRLIRRPECQKILIVLSDGSPYDVATSLGQDRSYLESHLHDVVNDIEKSCIHLVGLGVGDDVGRFYTNTALLSDFNLVPELLFDHLDKLLCQPR